MSAQKKAMDAVTRSMNVIHNTLQKITGGRVGSTLFGMQAVQLHTIGKKTGQRRTVWLTSPVKDANRTVLIASKGGDERHPDWYHNLVANPDVEITEGDTTRPFRARTATPEEKAELWPQVVAAYKGYAGYQKRTDRDIPVVICEPR